MSAAAGGSVAPPGTAAVAGSGVTTSATTATPVAGMGAASTGAAGATAAAGSSAQGAAGEGMAAAGGPSMGMVTLKFTTKSYGGFYAPLNYLAVWFETGDGKFVKTVARWAGAAHSTDLVAWTKASGGWPTFFGGGNAADMMDAMSSATLRQHGMHSVTWDMKDADKKLVPDGDYVAVMELTEDRGFTPGPVLRVPFKKGPQPQMVEPPDEKSFTGVSLTYQP